MKVRFKNGNNLECINPDECFSMDWNENDIWEDNSASALNGEATSLKNACHSHKVWPEQSKALLSVVLSFSTRTTLFNVHAIFF